MSASPTPLQPTTYCPHGHIAYFCAECLRGKIDALEAVAERRKEVMIDVASQMQMWSRGDGTTNLDKWATTLRAAAAEVAKGDGP